MKNFQGKKYAYIYHLNTKIRSTMLCLSVFELCSCWVPLEVQCMNRSRSFAVLFVKLSRIERQSRLKYKNAVPN